MIWYLAGPITGSEGWESRFEQAAKRLRESGLQIVSPLDISKPNEDWGFNMRRCLRSLTECDGLILLEGWEGSRGAGIERSVAEGLDMVVVEYENLWSNSVS